MSTAAPAPEWLAGLVDDAAIFPPGNAPLPDAVAAHRRHRAAEYAPLVGPFVASDLKLPDLLDELSDDVEPLPTTVVVTGGAGALEGVVRWATRPGCLDLRGLEIMLRDDDTGAVVHNARRILAALDQLRDSGDLAEEVAVYVEPPRLYGAPPTPGWLGALDEITAAGHRLKFRTGGVEADAFPAAHELAASVEAALDREAPFKCTAGLHRAVRHTDAESGFEHHGFLNVLLATRATWDGGSIDDAARLLETKDVDEVRGALEALGPDALTSTRRWFVSVGSCSVTEPLTDLVALGLVDARLADDGPATGGQR